MKETVGHDEIFSRLKSTMPSGGDLPLLLPPPAFTELQGRFETYVDRKEMRVSFPVQSKHVNPLGRLQGGFLAAAIDATMGPLSYLAAGKATVTLDLHINYLRGVEPPERIVIDAQVVGRGNSTMFLRAQVWNERKKLVADAVSQVMIFSAG